MSEAVVSQTTQNSETLATKQEKKTGKRIPSTAREDEITPCVGLILKVIPLKLFLNMVPSSQADHARCVDVVVEDEMRVKTLGLST